MSSLPNGNALPINDSLKDYCTSLAVDDWGDKEWAARLHGWCARMNQEFGLQIATPVIHIDRARFRGAQAYRPGRNGLGLLHQLSVKRDRLADPEALLLAGLLRELLKEHQSIHGAPSPWGHFNRPLRDQAEALGLYFDRRGRLLAVKPGPFMKFLAREGVDIAPLQVPNPEGERVPADSSKQKKWTCGCTIARVATVLRAHCDACGRKFKLAPSGGGKRRPGSGRGKRRPG